MALIFDQLGNVIGDDGLGETFEQGANAGAQIQRDTLTPAKLGYIESKIADFQRAVLLADTTVADIQELMLYTDDEEILQKLQDQLDEFELRRPAIKFAAESFNAVADIVNGMGGNMDRLMIPSGLGFAPLVPIVYIGSISAGIALITWIYMWARQTFDIGLAAALSINDKELQDQVLTTYTGKMAELKETEATTVSSALSSLKYVALAYVAYLAYTAFQNKGR